MEKFSDWRDKGTGISPFMPIPPAKRPVLVKYVLGPILALLKTVLSVFLFLLAAVCWPVGFLFRPVIRLLLLVTFNVSEIEFLADGVKKSNTKLINSKRPDIGQLVFVNFSSPLDCLVLYLVSKSNNCIFLTADSRGNLRKLNGFLYTFSFALAEPKLSTQAADPVDLFKLKNNVVFVLAEGTTSNNRSVLAFPPIELAAMQSAYKNTFQFKAISIKVLPPSLVTTPIPQSATSYLFSHLSHVKLDVKFKLKSFDLGDLKPTTIREKLSNYGSLKLTGPDLDIVKKLSFISAYNKTSRRV
ncbi:hypothetical protein KL938_003621 [Ogataea parapolymorpha]|nr:hypothetical protein KL938_003621 [Ogataea parapolymorpha]